MGGGMPLQPQHHRPGTILYCDSLIRNLQQPNHDIFQWKACQESSPDKFKPCSHSHPHKRFSSYPHTCFLLRLINLIRITQLWWTSFTEEVWSLLRHADLPPPLFISLSPPQSLFITLFVSFLYITCSFALHALPDCSLFSCLISSWFSRSTCRKKTINCYKATIEGDTQIKGEFSFIFLNRQIAVL